jgi:hypothetical protein
MIFIAGTTGSVLLEHIGYIPPVKAEVNYCLNLASHLT